MATQAQKLQQKIDKTEKFTFTPAAIQPGQEIASLRQGRANVQQVPWIAPYNQRVVERTFKEFLGDRFDPNDPTAMAEYASLLKASTRDKDLAAEIAQYRLFTLQNDVMAIPFALAAFQAVNLDADELPLIVRPRSRNHQRFSVNSVGQDGGVTREQWRSTRDIEHIELDLLATDRIEYSMMDLEHGDVSNLEAINTELRYDMEMQIDSLALTNMDAAELDSGLRDRLSIHPSVDVNNIPDTNHLVLNSTDNTWGAFAAGDNGKLTLAKMKVILKHIALFGSAGGADEAFTIANAFVSPQNLSDPWDFVDLVAGYDSTGAYIENPAETVPSSVRDSIYAGGQFTSAWGYSWNWIPNSQISQGRMRITTTQPLGWFFTKTSMDKIIEWNSSNSPDHDANNMGEIMMQRSVSFFVPDLWQHRVLFVDL